MKTKQAAINEIKGYIDSGLIDKSDLELFINNTHIKTANDNLKHKHSSVVSIMFYIAGIILFSTIMSVISQFWDTGDAFTHIFLSSIIGLLLWFLSYYLIEKQSKSETIIGLANSLLMTGSLLITVGGFIIVYEIFGDSSGFNYLPSSIALVVVGLLHIMFDRLVGRDILPLAGLFLTVAAFPMAVFGILKDSILTADVWYVVLISAAVILVYSSRVFVKINPSRQNLRKSFDIFAAFFSMFLMYMASYGEFDILWLVSLIISIFGIFSLSIIMQSRELLGGGSFFLVLTIITISFKYFSDLGTTFCLIVSTIGLLISAMIASEINKKYIK